MFLYRFQVNTAKVSRLLEAKQSGQPGVPRLFWAELSGQPAKVSRLFWPNSRDNRGVSRLFGAQQSGQPGRVSRLSGAEQLEQPGVSRLLEAEQSGQPGEGPLDLGRTVGTTGAKVGGTCAEHSRQPGRRSLGFVPKTIGANFLGALGCAAIH